MTARRGLKDFFLKEEQMTETSLNDGLLRAHPPKPKLAIGREKVLVAIGVLGVLFAVSIVLGKASSKPKAVAQSEQLGSPGYNVTMLPSSYSELPVPPLPPAKREVLQIPGDEESKLEALLAKLAEERIKQAQAARRAPVTFQNVSIPKDGAALLSATDDPQEPTGTSISMVDDQNRQEAKNAYLTRKRDSSVYLPHRLISPRSPYQLMAGTLIPGLLLTGLNSDLPGQMLGQVSQSVYDTVSGRYLLIPQGTKVLGEYDSRIVYGQERMLIVWTRLIFPNGKSISLEGMPGVDLSGYAGLSDQVNNHWGRLLAGVVFSSVLSATAQMAEGRNYSTIDPSFGELATQGVARNANQVGQQITNRNLNIQPTLEVRPGFRFNVFVNKDIVLEPYKE